SHCPGSVFVMPSCACASSSPETALLDTIPLNSFMTSTIASLVLSVCTGAYPRNGRCPRASGTNAYEPYDQCLPSRRFMLRRAMNDPPSTCVIASSAISSGFAVGGASCPARITDCSAPGRSRMYTVVPEGCDTVLSVFDGTDPFFQPWNSASSFGLISAIVVSPTTTIVAWSGLNQVWWN